MTDREKIDSLLAALTVLREDAQMALEHRWSRSDEGFEAQITVIDDTVNGLGESLPSTGEADSKLVKLWARVKSS